MKASRHQQSAPGGNSSAARNPRAAAELLRQGTTGYGDSQRDLQDRKTTARVSVELGRARSLLPCEAGEGAMQSMVEGAAARSGSNALAFRQRNPCC